MRHRFWIVLAMLMVGSMLAVERAAEAGDNAADLAAQLNAQWAPNPPAYSAESVGQQRGPEKFGGWGGISKDLTGQKLGDLMKSTQSAHVTGTGQSPSAKGLGKSASKAAGNAEEGSSKAFDKSGHSAGVAVTGPV